MRDPSRGLTRAALGAVGADPEATAACWSAIGVEPADIDWPEALLLSLQHRLEGLFRAAIAAAEWDEVISPVLLRQLERRSGIAELRHRLHRDALSQAAREAPDLVADLVLIKGAALAYLYGEDGKRGVGDFDLIVRDDEAEARLRSVLVGLGYWAKDGRNGPTFFRALDLPASAGCEYIAFDVHVGAPGKYNRRAVDAVPWHHNSTRAAPWGFDVRVPDAAVHLLELITHIHEHAASWLHCTLEDDLQLIHAIDVELLVAASGASLADVMRLAASHHLLGEFALGVAVCRRMRPAALAPCAEVDKCVAAVEDLVDLVALPTGESTLWPEPIESRMWSTRRSQTAFSLLSDGTRRSDWHHWTTGLKKGYEAVEDIGHAAFERLAAS